MKVINIGYKTEHDDKFLVSRQNGSGDYILLFVRTNGIFVLNNKEVYTKPNSAIIFKKGTPQIYKAVKGNKYVDDWVHFEMDEEDIQFFQYLKLPFDTIIKLDSLNQFSELIKNMFMEKYSNTVHNEKISEMYMKIIFMKLSDFINDKSSNISGKYYRELLEIRSNIYNNPEEAVSIDNISNKLFVSRSYLQHLYKKYFDSSIFEDVKKSRMEYAKYILSSSTTSVDKTAYMCGYKNPVHFMREFKKTCGVTPTEYRKNSNLSEEEFLKAKSHNPYII